MKKKIMKKSNIVAASFVITASILSITLAHFANTDKNNTSINYGIAGTLSKADADSVDSKKDDSDKDDKKTVTVEAVKQNMSMVSNPKYSIINQTEEEFEKTMENEKKKQDLNEYDNLGVADVDTYLNIRDEADEGGSIIGKLPINAGCEIISEENGWYYMTSGNVTGYVSSEYIITGDEAKERALENMHKAAKVNADMLMVREAKTTDSKIYTYVAMDEEIEVDEDEYDENSDWIKVNIDDITGYVKAEFVDVYDTLPKGVKVEEIKTEDGYSSVRVELIEYAKQFLGNPYVWGGTSLTNGTDCSGFTMRVFEHFGYYLDRTSGAQSHNGTRISLDEIQPGDLLFYNHGSSIGHVAIYIGGGQIIHASTERTGIIIGNAFYTTPACATRIID
ncbi:SH3 domain-containing protein [Lachnospiraceae bacterium RM5]|nr:SH3 domain-containing protein [Lachnospiraceae bacterium RM5]